MRLNRGAVIAAAASIIGLLAACSSDVSGQGDVTPASSAAGSASSTPAGSASAPVTSTGSTRSGPAKEASDTAAAIRDFTRVSYTVPEGFVRAAGYSQVIKLEQSVQDYYFVPKAAYNGRDVITILLYTLPDDVAVDTPQKQSDRVDYYNKKLGATLPNGTREATLAGLPAFQENVVQPPDFHYSTYFAFGRTHLLQFSCQVGSARSAADVIAKACDTMMASLRVS